MSLELCCPLVGPIDRSSESQSVRRFRIGQWHLVELAGQDGLEAAILADHLGAGPDQPMDGDQDCVRMVGLSSPSEATMFTDEACSEVFGFLCECDDFPPAPQNF